MLDHLEDIIDNRPEQLSDIVGRMIYDAPSDTARPVSGPAQRRVVVTACDTPEADLDGAAWRAANGHRAMERAAINGR